MSGGAGVSERERRPSSGGALSTRSVLSSNGGEGSKTQSENAFYTECKTTYLSMFKSIDDRILSKHALYDLLVRCGRSPCKSAMDQYWSAGTTDYLSYTHFCNIMRKEKPVCKNDVIGLFHSLDSTDQGVISEEKLTKLLTGYGEVFSPSEMKQLLAIMHNFSLPSTTVSTNSNANAGYSYTKFTSSIIEARSECASRHKICLAADCSPDSVYNKDSSSRRDRDNSRMKRVSKLRSKLQPNEFSKWTTKVTRKGHLRVVDGKVLQSTCYSLSLSSSCCVFISAEPIAIVNCDKLQDCQVLLLCVKLDKQGNLSDGSSSSHSVFLSDSTDGDKFYLKADLLAGNYVIVPFTFSASLAPRKSHSHSPTQIDLVLRGRSDSKEVSVECGRAIETLFELVDLDGDGAISRQELDLFQMCCSGEKFSDEDWNALKNMWEVIDDCITHRGFVDLHKMEADGDPKDLWNSFSKMGFNNDLLLDECCPIKIEFAAEKEDVLTIGMEESCRSMEEVESVICKLATNTKHKGSSSSSSSKTKSFEHVNITSFKSSSQLGFICVNNSGRNCTNIRLDLSSSSNLKLHSHYTDIAVPANTRKVAQLCVPADASKEIIIKMAAEVKN